MIMQHEFTDGQVTSADGTSIGFRKVGSGPALVLVQGAMGTVRNYAEFAQALADRFTVYTPERRGRGLSPKPYSPAHSITRDVEDVDAVMAYAGAEFLYGLSSGAMITLESARTLPRVARAAVYEPPFYPGGMALDKIVLFNQEVGRNDLASALVTAGRLVGLAPPPIRILPKPVARLLTGLVIRQDARSHGEYAPLTELIPSMRYDFNVVGGMDGKMPLAREIRKPMLVLSGTKSPAYLRQSAAQLLRNLPEGRHIEFNGLDHSGSWNKERGGNPGPVAEAMMQFFG